MRWGNATDAMKKWAILESECVVETSCFITAVLYVEAKTNLFGLVGEREGTFTNFTMILNTILYFQIRFCDKSWQTVFLFCTFKVHTPSYKA